ncbi:uncharacterized protein LOC118179753 isoform X2 [Stegodyphus dumicola]|uniref:uncharacterized protein LOC118179753 isoform X2 n=1 Tax=Stegodyphus dumicola TaxID=202533 RepID=UPI0015A78F23|nr:uncharacterized protein LOC118179753 isoform X2 [Stegodyphus dumicola]
MFITFSPCISKEGTAYAVKIEPAVKENHALKSKAEIPVLLQDNVIATLVNENFSLKNAPVKQKRKFSESYAPPKKRGKFPESDTSTRKKGNPSENDTSEENKLTRAKSKCQELRENSEENLRTEGSFHYDYREEVIS